MRRLHKFAVRRMRRERGEPTLRVRAFAAEPVVLRLDEREIAELGFEHGRRRFRGKLACVRARRRYLLHRVERLAREIGIARRAPVVFQLRPHRRRRARGKHDRRLARQRSNAYIHARNEPRQREHLAVERAAAAKQRAFDGLSVAVGRKHDMPLRKVDLARAQSLHQRRERLRTVFE